MHDEISQEKSQFVRQRRLDINIKMDLRKMGCEHDRWIELLWNQVSSWIYVLQSWLLLTLSISELYSVNDRTIDEYGAVGGMRIGRENRRTRRKPA
jgi:hypothetical protein